MKPFKPRPLAKDPPPIFTVRLAEEAGTWFRAYALKQGHSLGGLGRQMIEHVIRELRKEEEK